MEAPVDCRSSGVQHLVEWNVSMAAAVLFVMPVIILFFLAQRVSSRASR